MDGTFELPADTVDDTEFSSQAGTSTRRPAADPDFARRLAAELPFLRRNARRWKRDPADCDDLVQDTLVRALAGAHSWQQGTDLRAWLYTIMRNQAYASSASAARMVQASEDDIVEAACPPATDSRLVLRDVDTALHRLPMKQRLALMLIAVEGKSYEDGARAMDTSIDALRCHLARGRQRLRELVDATAECSPFLRAGAGRPMPVRATWRR